MPIAVLAENVLDFSSGGSASYSNGTFAVPPGTDCLVVDLLFRGFSGTGVNTLDSIKHNGVDLTIGHENAAAGFDRINSAIAYLRNPGIGTFTIAIAFDLQVRGCVARVQALSGVKQSGSPIGQKSAQRVATAATDTVGLGLTPAATADSLLCASLGIATPTTLAAWTGAGFVEQETGQYTGGDNLTATFRRRLNAPASANTAQAKFGASDTNIGGLLYEILAEPTGVDVSGEVNFSLAMSGSVSGPSSAKQSDAAYYSGDTAWTDIWVLQPDFAGVDRRIHSVGPDLAPNMALDQVATGTYATNCYRLRTRLSTGELVIETLPGSQSTGPTVLAFSYDGATAAAYVNGTPSLASSEAGIGGTVDVGAGGEAIGGHAAASPPPYTGKIARHMRFRGQMSAAQIALLSRSVLDPGSIWGIGQEDDAEDPNQSPVALPELVRPDGRAMVRITPRVIDPNGTPPDLTGVTQPVHGAVSIDGRDLVLNLEPGWVGQDGFTYTATDAGGKSSTARIVIDQLRPALLARGDAITLTESSSVTFDPRVNDVGAGSLQVAAATDGAHGTTAILADGRIVFTAGAVTGDTTDSFSYTITDDWGSATASVAVAIKESGSSFVSASNDSEETTVGTAVLINVLANDTASADNLPLVVQPGSITTPVPSGAAVLQSDGQILYTPASGFADVASFEYAIKPASKAAPTSTATVSVRVVSALTGLPKYPFGFADWRSYSASKTRPVGFALTGAAAGTPTGGYDSGRAGLEDALADSLPGEQIVLADGDYIGASVPITRNGASGEANWIAIRARNHLKAVIKCQLDINASYIWTSGLKQIFQPTTMVESSGAADSAYGNNSFATLIRKPNVRVTNSSFPVCGVKLVWSATLANITITYNSLVGAVPAAYEYYFKMLCHAVGNNGNVPPNTEIAYNLLNNTQQPNLKPGSSSNRFYRGGFVIHPSHVFNKANSTRRSFWYHHNLHENYLGGIYCKRQIRVSNCVILSGEIQLRHGFRNVPGASEQMPHDGGGLIEECYTKEDIVISGAGAMVVNCRADRSATLMCGTQPPEEGMAGDYQAADYTTIANCSIGTNVFAARHRHGNGQLGVIKDEEGGKIDNVRIFNGDYTPTVNDTTYPEAVIGPSWYTRTTAAATMPAGYTKRAWMTAATLRPRIGCDPEP